MMKAWVGVDAVGLRYFESGMNAMNYLMRSLIAAPLIAALLTFGGSPIAARTTSTHKASADTKLSKVGFLDFKTLLYSPSTGDNLDGVFNQIKFIGPEMFRNAVLRPDVLRKFKRSQSPVLPTNPLWEWGKGDLDLLNLDVLGKPMSISSGLTDAILTDITDGMRNHGLPWMLNPAIGPGTAAYFNAATQNVIDQIEKLENGLPLGAKSSQNFPATQSVMNIPHPQPVFFFGLGLVMIGLLRRWSRRNSKKPRRPVDPVTCFDTIGRSPIRFVPKTA